MIDRVLDCLLATPGIGKVLVLAQEPEKLAAGVAQQAGGRIVWIASTSGIAQSVLSVLDSERMPWPVLLTTADHPLLTPNIVGEFIHRARQGDVAIGMVERGTMLRRYPENRRTWLKFSDGAYSGANLFAFRSERARAALALWSRAERDRKQAFRLFWHFGPLLAVRAMLRLIGLRDALARAGRRLGLDAQLVVLDTPEAAIDVDKLSDHALVEDILVRRAEEPAPVRPYSGVEESPGL